MVESDPILQGFQLVLKSSNGHLKRDVHLWQLILLYQKRISMFRSSLTVTYFWLYFLVWHQRYKLMALKQLIVKLFSVHFKDNGFSPDFIPSWVSSWALHLHWPKTISYPFKFLFFVVFDFLSVFVQKKTKTLRLTFFFRLCVLVFRFGRLEIIVMPLLTCCCLWALVAFSILATR